MTVGTVDIAMPWWHWLLIALIVGLAALAYVLIVIAVSNIDQTVQRVIDNILVLLSAAFEEEICQ